MKTKITFLLALIVGFNLSFAQQDEELLAKLSIFHEYVKSGNFDAAYQPWMEVRNANPKFNNAIYIDGEKILDHKIEKSTGTEKAGFVSDLAKLWEQRAEHFASKTPKGEYAAKACQLLYDNRDVLNKTDLELYECFDAAYKLDKATFTNPKSLYTYFSLMVDLYDAGQKPAENLFDKYDDITEKIEEEVKNYSEKLNPIIEKEEAGTPLSGKEPQYKKFYESYLNAYDQISQGLDKKLGDRANCANLIPLYRKNFDANKTNAVWLQRAAAKMNEKECTTDPLFFELVNAYHELSPSANSAFYLGILKDKDGDTNGAIAFYEQAISLETDNFRKAKLYDRIANKLKAKGNYGKARSYYREELKLNPSNGRPYLAIAQMYANSANSCGDSTFNKRAVYWLAADEARKAARVDATLKNSAQQYINSYMDRAPSKSDVFTAGNAGQTISIGCWIGASVTVPSL
ncbi:MAG: tetratricopeptide repeat protein [Flavobacteriaceae bacterium]